MTTERRTAMIDIYTIEVAFTALARAKRDREQDIDLLKEILREVKDADTLARLRQTERTIDLYKKGANKLILLAYRVGLDRVAINDLKAKMTTKWDLFDAGENRASVNGSGEMEIGDKKVDITTSTYALPTQAQFAKRTKEQIEAEIRALAERKGVLKKRFYRVLDVLNALGDTRETRDLPTAEIDAIKKIWAISPSKMTNNGWYHRKYGKK
jgi:hypothetical protein